MADNTVINPGTGGDSIRDKDRSGVKTQIVGLDLGIGTGTESLMSGSLPVTRADTTGSGNLTASDQAVTATVAGLSGWTVQVTGTWVGTITFEGTADGTNWVSVLGTLAGVGNFSTTTSVNGIWRGNCAALNSFRARMSSYTSGTAAVSLILSSDHLVMQPGPLPNSQSYGSLRVTPEPSELFFDPLESLDANKWTTAGTAPSFSGGQLTMASSTTTAATSQIIGVPTFIQCASVWLQTAYAVKLDTAGAAVSSAHRFWGHGTAQATPATTSASTKLTNAWGFEVDTDGKMYACIYAAGVRVFAQDLSNSGTSTSKDRQPLDGAFHRYVLQSRSDRCYWFIDDMNFPVATASFLTPAVQKLPMRVQQINNATSQAVAPTLVIQSCAVTDTGHNLVKIADPNYPWRQAVIGSDGSIQTQEKVSTTATPTNVTAAATNTTLKAANTSRIGFMLHNDSAAACYVNWGATASSTAYVFRLDPDEFYEMPTPIYTGAINGIWTSATGTMRVTELT